MEEIKYINIYGQFNLIDRLSSLPAPQKLARPHFWGKITFSGNFGF
jgi:hypothetical protein